MWTSYLYFSCRGLAAAKCSWKCKYFLHSSFIFSLQVTYILSSADLYSFFSWPIFSSADPYSLFSWPVFSIQWNYNVLCSADLYSLFSWPIFSVQWNYNILCSAELYSLIIWLFSVSSDVLHYPLRLNIHILCKDYCSRYSLFRIPSFTIFSVQISFTIFSIQISFLHDILCSDFRPVLFPWPTYAHFRLCNSLFSRSTFRLPLFTNCS